MFKYRWSKQLQSTVEWHGIYRIAGNFRAVQNFAFFADWLICAKIKTTKIFKNDVTPGNTHAQGRAGSAEAISRVTRKQSAKR